MTVQKISKNIVVSLVGCVRNSDGTLIEEFSPTVPLNYLHGHDGLIKGLENALEGCTVGEKLSIFLLAKDAYGEFDDDLVQRVPKTIFGGEEKLEVGMQFLADTSIGMVPVEITAVEDEYVVVDGNHALAGQDLKFDLEVTAIRQATQQEIEHGHSHDDESLQCRD